MVQQALDCSNMSMAAWCVGEWLHVGGASCRLFTHKSGQSWQIVSKLALMRVIVLSSLTAECSVICFSKTRLKGSRVERPSQLLHHLNSSWAHGRNAFIQVAATKQGSQTSSDLGRATVLAAADQLRESQQEAQQLSAALQAAQAEVRYSLTHAYYL